MIDITNRRAETGDSGAIQNILKKTFEEYDINLPEGYSFADVENLDMDYFSSQRPFNRRICNSRVSKFGNRFI